MIFLGEAVIGGEKQQKKNGVADGKNRKALGDIGNLANVRGVVEAKPHRPITRFPLTFSFFLSFSATFSFCCLEEVVEVNIDVILL